MPAIRYRRQFNALFRCRSKTRAGFGMRVVGGALVCDDSNIARTPAEIKATLSSSQGLSEEKEIDGLTELAREKLWQSAWGAVRDCVCYERAGSDLALHICHQLRDLYCGGMDGEFRYSQNVKSLLELVICIARPRTGIIFSSSDDKLNPPSACVNNPNAEIKMIPLNKKMDKIADSQLVRGVMSLLQAITPVDIVAFSSLMDTLALLSFGRSCVEMNYKINDTDSGLKKNRCIVLGPVDAKLREEVGIYMVSILSAKEQSVEGGSETPANLPAVFLEIPPSWLGVALEVVVRQFVNELCFGPSLKRSRLIGVLPINGKVGQSEASSPSGKKNPVNRENSFSSRGIGGFFSSISKMLTNTLESDSEESDSGNDLPGNIEAETSTAAAAFRDNILQNAGNKGVINSGCTLSALRDGTDLLFDIHGHPTAGDAELSIPQPCDWKPFKSTKTDLKILQLLFRQGLRPALMPTPPTGKQDKNSASALDKKPVVQQALTYKQHCMWSHVLTSILCILSPWRNVELSLNSHSGDGGSLKSASDMVEKSSSDGIPTDGIGFAADVIFAVGAVVTFLIDSRYRLHTFFGLICNLT